MSFNPGGSGGISSAADVALSNPTNEETLVYNSTTQKWRNKTVTLPETDTATATQINTTTSATRGALNDKFMAYVGSAASPVTSTSTSRPSTIGPVYWICAAGVTPTNALSGDLLNIDGTLSVAAGPTTPPPEVGEDVTAPAVPANLVASPSGGQVALSWSASADNSGGVGGVYYEVYRSTSAGFTITSGAWVNTTVGTGYTDTPPSTGTYYYKVRAIDANSNVSAGAEVSATVSGTAPAPDPDEPGSLYSQAYLANAANFGVPVGTTFTDQAASTIENVSGQTFTNRRFTGSSNCQLSGSNNTFINCRWEGQLTLLPGARNNTITHCEAMKMNIVSDVTGARINDWKSYGQLGQDGFTVTSDRAGKPQASDIIIDGCYIAGNQASLIGGSANHYDSLQVRGVNGLTIRNWYMDHGTTFSTYFNATIFLENANGGNSNVTIDNVYSRAAGYTHLYLFGTNITVKNSTFAKIPNARLTYNGGANQNFTELNNKWDDGSAIATLKV